MDKQSRVSSITRSIDDFKEVQNLALLILKAAIESRDWLTLQKCSEKLIAAEAQITLLSSETKQLQAEIEDEKEKEILETIS